MLLSWPKARCTNQRIVALAKLIYVFYVFDHIVPLEIHSPIRRKTKIINYETTPPNAVLHLFYILSLGM